jgi:hypothetical protein
MTELGEMGGRPRRRRLDHAWQMGYRRIRYAAVVVCRPAKSPECDLIAGSTVRELQHRQRMGGTDAADHHREFESRGYEVERSTGRRRREDVQTQRSAHVAERLVLHKRRAPHRVAADDAARFVELTMARQALHRYSATHPRSQIALSERDVPDHGPAEDKVDGVELGAHDQREGNQPNDEGQPTGDRRSAERDEAADG